MLVVACDDPPAPPPDDVDAPPTVAGLTVETDEDAPVTFTVSAEDPDGDPLEVTIEAPRHGAIVTY